MGFTPSQRAPEAKSWWENLVQNITQTALTAGTSSLVGGLVKKLIPGADVAAEVAGAVAGQTASNATTPAPKPTGGIGGRNFASDGIYQSGQMYPMAAANVPVDPWNAPARFQQASVSPALNPTNTAFRESPSFTQRPPTASAASIPASTPGQAVQTGRNTNETYEEYIRRMFGFLNRPGG